MVIGVPKEVKDHEYRVSVTPDGVRALRQAGHNVWIEPSAGVGSGYSDEDYRSAGATMAESKEQLFQQATLIVKVKSRCSPNAISSIQARPCLPICIWHPCRSSRRPSWIPRSPRLPTRRSRRKAARCRCSSR